MNVATLDPELARALRLMLIAEHLNLFDEDKLNAVARHLAHQSQSPVAEQQAVTTWNSLQKQLENPLIALGIMVERANENLRRFKAGQPLVGHLLPYMTAEEARREGLQFIEDTGWLETPS